MDYAQMSVSELRDACQARGLGTARSRAELIQRLTDDDASQGDAVVVDVPVSPETTPALFAEAGTRSVVPQRVFQQTFDAEPGGPDEETHLAYRQATVQAAAAAGLQTRGDARLASTRDGVWVYEVSVRQVT